MNICTSLSRSLCAISPCDVVPERLQQRHMLALALTLCIGRFSTAGGQQAAGDCRGSQLPVPKVAESLLVPGHDLGSDSRSNKDKPNSYAAIRSSELGENLHVPPMPLLPRVAMEVAWGPECRWLSSRLSRCLTS